jgi:hypothetical protein
LWDELQVATMVVMAAKWPGKCRRCGKPILMGVVIDWTKESGAVHITPEECERAPATLPPLRGLVENEDPKERMMIVEYLLGARWKSATSKRYEKLPHQYSLRKGWDDDEYFVWCCSYIRRTGYQKFFIGRTWVYYDIGEYQYWDCGGPLANVSLINRAVRHSPSAWLGAAST